MSGGRKSAGFGQTVVLDSALVPLVGNRYTPSVPEAPIELTRKRENVHIIAFLTVFAV